jgi:hypothetical protein
MRRSIGMTGKIRFTSTGVLIIMLLLLSMFASWAPAQEKDKTLTIAYVADELGRIEPCG